VHTLLSVPCYLRGIVTSRTKRGRERERERERERDRDRDRGITCIMNGERLTMIPSVVRAASKTCFRIPLLNFCYVSNIDPPPFLLRAREIDDPLLRRSADGLRRIGGRVPRFRFPRFEISNGTAAAATIRAASVLILPRERTRAHDRKLWSFQHDGFPFHRPVRTIGLVSYSFQAYYAPMRARSETRISMRDISCASSFERASRDRDFRS